MEERAVADLDAADSPPGTPAASGDASVPLPARTRTGAGPFARLGIALGTPLDRLRSGWPWMRIVVFALVGAVLAVVLFGRVPAKVGPFETTVSARPSLNGHTVVHLAPLGTIDLDTHDWPLALDLRVDEIGVADAERLAGDPTAIDRLGDDAADQVRSALVALAIRCVIVALLGGVAGALVARLTLRTAVAGAGVAGLLVAGLGLGAAATFDANAVSEPRYSGLLTRAPTAVGSIEAVLDRFGEYREQLSDLVDNMATLYLAGSELPTFEADDAMVRVMHVSDIHLNPQAFDLIERISDQFAVDAVVDTGDLTDWGTDPETRFVGRIGELDVPYVYVRGNHDSRRTQAAVADQPNAVVLDGEGATVAGLRFWGIGDPRYTPDKSEQDGRSEAERAEAFAPEVAERLAEDEPPDVDVALVHDERMAEALGGQVPLVLAGHTHDTDRAVIDPLDDDEGSDDQDAEPTDDADADERGDTTTSEADGDRDSEGGADETLLLVEGSTGGAGLRGLQGEEPEPLTASILYFDPDTGRLVAYDRLTVAWLSDAGATIERHIVGEPTGGVPTD
ncbi:MAG: metallophosphoesterase [Acidimicrobiales bacterium]|nr:metallophosphoesterase [Acidimicrobiales bacterium]